LLTSSTASASAACPGSGDAGMEVSLDAFIASRQAKGALPTASTATLKHQIS